MRHVGLDCCLQEALWLLNENDTTVVADTPAIHVFSRLVHRYQPSLYGLVGHALSSMSKHLWDSSIGALREDRATVTDSTVVVTGGSGGLGQSLVAQLGEAKYNNRVHSIDIAPSDSTLPNVASHCLNLQKPGLEHWVNLLESTGTTATVKQPVDLLVLNAAINRTGRHVDLEDADIVNMVDVNLVCPLVMTSAALRHNTSLGAAPPAFTFLCSLSHQLSYPGGAVYGERPILRPSFFFDKLRALTSLCQHALGVPRHCATCAR